jgi:hypothetical protein
MKNLFTYYIVILAPLGFLICLNKASLIGGTAFAGLMIFYLLVYRTYTDGKRLFDKEVIEKKDIWKMIIPGKRIAFFRELYLN